MLTFNSAISLLSFFIFGFFLGFIQRKAMFFILIFFLFYILTVLDLANLLLINDHINLFIFFRFELVMLDIKNIIIPILFVPSIIFSLISFIVVLIAYKIRKYFFVLSKEIQKKIILITFIIITPCFLLSNTTKAYEIIIKQGIQYALGKTIFIPKTDLGNKYVFPKDIQAQKGKNIVVIYLESFENTLLINDKLVNLVPSLKQLTQNGWYQYNNYNEAQGANWTSGALYATQTSFPAFFELSPRHIFPPMNDLNLTSWSKVLKTAGYKNIFMMSEQILYGGKKYLLDSLKYDLRNDLIPKSYDNYWLGHDLDLFEAAKKEYLELLKEPPFNLTLLSVDTHFPKGHPDARLQDKVNISIQDNHKFTIATTDYLVGDFIDFIYKQPDSENTVIVILGDHLMMGNDYFTPLTKELSGERKILLLTNKPIDNYKTNDPIFYYDIPRIILNLAEVKNNAVFSKDIFPEMSEEFTKQNYMSFMGINIRSSIQSSDNK